MILVKSGILEALQNETIIIRSSLGFDAEKQISTNSVDLTLAARMYAINRLWTVDSISGQFTNDKGNNVHPVLINLSDHMMGYVLDPAFVYLAVTNEYIYTNAYVPYLKDKSSMGRMFCPTHFNAGLGDVGFAGHYTLEIAPSLPTVVYENMMVCQIAFEKASAPVENDYLTEGRYNNTFSNTPLPTRSKGVSILYKNKEL